MFWASKLIVDQGKREKIYLHVDLVTPFRKSFARVMDAKCTPLTSWKQNRCKQKHGSCWQQCLSQIMWTIWTIITPFRLVSNEVDIYKWNNNLKLQYLIMIDDWFSLVLVSVYNNTNVNNNDVIKYKVVILWENQIDIINSFHNKQFAIHIQFNLIWWIYYFIVKILCEWLQSALI